MTNGNIKIEDNFLAQEIFDEIQRKMLSDSFPWYFTDTVDFLIDVDKFQFTHGLYLDSVPTSNWFQNMTPIVAALDPVSILRIKANLLTRTSNIIENEFHLDMSFSSKEKQKNHWATSIFYINTNNGYTEFENGTKVESVANRMVTFPANMKHRGTSCTDQPTRIVINFNYFN